MVYESDFYTTRRPYSRPSPSITSYSVTTDIDPTISKGRYRSAGRFRTTGVGPAPSAADSSESEAEPSDFADLADPYGPYSRFARYIKPTEQPKQDRSRPPGAVARAAARATARAEVPSDSESEAEAEADVLRRKPLQAVALEDSDDEDEDGFYETKFSKLLRESRAAVRQAPARPGRRRRDPSSDEDEEDGRASALLSGRRFSDGFVLSSKRAESDGLNATLSGLDLSETPARRARPAGKTAAATRSEDEDAVDPDLEKYRPRQVTSTREAKKFDDDLISASQRKSRAAARPREEDGGDESVVSSGPTPTRATRRPRGDDDNGELESVASTRTFKSTRRPAADDESDDEESVLSSKPSRLTQQRRGSGQADSLASSTSDARRPSRRPSWTAQDNASVAARSDETSSTAVASPATSFRAARKANGSTLGREADDKVSSTASSYRYGVPRRKPDLGDDGGDAFSAASSAHGPAGGGRSLGLNRASSARPSRAGSEEVPVTRARAAARGSRRDAEQYEPPRGQRPPYTYRTRKVARGHQGQGQGAASPSPPRGAAAVWSSAAENDAEYQLMRKTNFRVDPYETRSVATEDPVEPSPYWRLRSRVRKGELPLCAIATYDIYRLEMFFRDLNFDDETRSIRAQTAALLKRVHSPIPRSRGPLHVVLPTPSSLMETPVPHRHTSDHYIEGLLAPINKVQRDVASRSFYVEHPRPYIGKGNLACVSFAGGKAYGKRRSHYDVPEDHHNVQDDIATLSYYNRARAVANGQEPGPEPAATSSRKARQYRPSTDSAAKAEPKAAEPAAAAAPRPAAAPIRQASVKEDPVAEAAAEAELAAETKAEPAPVTNGVAEADDEAARLAAEEAELERQLEAELRAEMEAKEAKKAKKAAAKKAAEEAEAKKAAEEAEAKKAAEEAAAKKAEEEAAAAAAAEAEAVAAAAAAAEAEAAAAAAKKAAEEEAELEKIVAAELEAERQAAEAKKAEEEKAAAEAAAEPAEPAAEEVPVPGGEGEEALSEEELRKRKAIEIIQKALN